VINWLLSRKSMADSCICGQQMTLMTPDRAIGSQHAWAALIEEMVPALSLLPKPAPLLPHWTY